MFEMFETSRAGLLPWLPFVKDEHRCVEESTFHIERMARNRRDSPGVDYTMGIFDRATGRPVGGTGLHRINAAMHEAEIGYYIRTGRRGEGLCTEAVRGLISWAFQPPGTPPFGGWGLRRLHVRCASGNLASQRVPRKLGLREEARLVAERWVEGLGWNDTLVWGVLAQEWDTEHQRLKAG